VSLDSNGAGALAHVEARVAALEHAITLVAQRWQDALVPRLLAIERDVDELLKLLRPQPQEEK